MTDDMLRAVANSGGPNSKGGVVQVNFYSGFISQAYRDAQKAQKPEVDKAVADAQSQSQSRRQGVHLRRRSKDPAQFADRIPRPPLSMLIDHIDHIAKVAGVDHVGLGSDFDGVSGQLARGPRLARRPAQDHRSPDGPRLLRRRLPQDPRRQSCSASSAKSKPSPKELQAENRPESPTSSPSTNRRYVFPHFSQADAFNSKKATLTMKMAFSLRRKICA
jgi:membrane dipeptidase